MRSITSRITSMGQGEPAINPVRMELRSNLSKSGCPNWAMNMVGTPYTAVHRSFSNATRVFSGSKYSEARTMVAPVVAQATVPRVQPKQ